MRMTILAVLAAPVLTGCQTVNTVVGGTETTYACVQGDSVVIRPGAGRRHLDVTYYAAGHKVYSGVLKATASDFGERFTTGDGTSFWLNNEKGLFSRSGEDMVLCHRN